jgi:aryl-alcohol dehydrogenase-like predicted oxidoreductase
MRRRLGRSGIDVSALGMGCWAIGGPTDRRGSPVGWGAVDDDESIRALRHAFDLGVDFFDTADMYGAGHSERILAKALGDKRDQIVIATKVGYTFDEKTRESADEDAAPDSIRRACDGSLRRLGTDRIDLYQFHLGGYDLARAADVLGVFDELVEEGKVRFIGWSTDDPVRAELFATSPNCVAIQQAFHVFAGNEKTLSVCETRHLASVVRSCLAMGLLTGKFTTDTKLPPDDVRHGWDFKSGVPADRLRKLDAVRDVLTSAGRTPAQGALAWLWARSEATIPIPGFKTVRQVEENVGAMRFGPLSKEQMLQIDQILSRSSGA